MEKSLKVSIPLKNLEQTMFFHESDVLELSGKGAMDEMFSSLIDRAECYLKTTPQASRSTREVPPHRPPCRNTTERDTYQMTQHQDPPVQHATGTEDEPRYIHSERSIAGKVFRHQRPHVGAPLDPRKPPSLTAQKMVISLKLLTFDDFGAITNNHKDTDSGQSESFSPQQQAAPKKRGRRSKSWKLNKEKRKLRRLGSSVCPH